MAQASQQDKRQQKSGRLAVGELCCANDGQEGAGIHQHGSGPWKQM